MSESFVGDEAREVDRLCRFLSRPGPRFGMGLAIYREEAVAVELRQSIVVRVAQQGSRVHTLGLGAGDAEHDLVDKMVDAVVGADGLLVAGFDALLLNQHEEFRASPAVANLNQRRDMLPHLLDARVLLWISEAAYPSFRHAAWDLHEVMLTVAEFKRTTVPMQPTGAREPTRPTYRGTRGVLQGRAEGRSVAKGTAVALLKLAEKSSSPATRADALASAARVHLREGDVAGALREMGEAVQIYEKSGDVLAASREELVRAKVLQGRRRFEEAYAAAEHARTLARRGGHRAEDAEAAGEMAEALASQGAFAEALRLRRQEQLPLARALGDALLEAEVLGAITELLALRGDTDDSVNTAIASIPLLRRAGDHEGAEKAEVRVATLLHELGHHDQAREMKKASAATRKQELIDELASVLFDGEHARLVARRAGFPPSRLPSFSTPIVFWTRVVEDAANGAIADGTYALAREAAAMYPGNKLFAAYAKSSS